MTPEDRHTPIRRFRVPDSLWEAYEGVCKRLGTSRNADLVDHIRAQVEQHGTTKEKRQMAAADAELVERRARTGGRPRKNSDDTVPEGPAQ
jgi:hypothetical protein